MRKNSKIIKKGTRFGKLVLQESSIHTASFVKCKCDCGNTTYPIVNNLKRGSSKSCGCLRPFVSNAPFKIPKGLKGRWTAYLHSARNRKLVWRLSANQFLELIQGTCVYCGKKDADGIDRIDSKNGYTFKNCVSCCKTCNYMKLSLSYEDFINHISKIYRHIVR